MTLTSDYQYIGRSNEVKSYNGLVSYYILLYAKTAGANGRHTVSVKLRMASPHDTSFYNWNTAGSASVDGVNAFAWSAQPIPNADWASTPITAGGVTYKRWIDLQEGSAQVNTGYGAARDVTVAAYWKRLDVSNPTGYLASVTPAEASIVVTLPAIAGASNPTLSASTIEMGKGVTVYTNPLSDGFTHKLTYWFGNAYGTIAENAGESAQWTPPLSLAQQIPSATAGMGAVYCTTYQNGVQVGGETSVGFTLTVPESVKPTATLSWEDSSGAYDRFGALVQNVSRLSLDITGTGVYGSTIRSAGASLDGASYTGGTLTKAGAQTLAATVTDSRGRTGSTSQSLSVLAYSVPTVKLSASRCNGAGESDDTGEFAHVTVSGSISDLPGNSAQLTFTYGETTEALSLSTGAFTREFMVEAPSVATLSLKAVVCDALLTATDAMTLSVGYATMDFLQGGRGIAFGATATKEGFTCAMDAEFLGRVKGTIFDAIYPVGSIYMSTNDTDPAALFGGTWERIRGRFLMGATSDGYPLGAEGGNAQHHHMLPMYTATTSDKGSGIALLDTTQYNAAASSMTATSVDNWFFPSGGGVGAGATFRGQLGVSSTNNLPPYLAVYIWKRSA